jgi:4-hydroxy-L-threonine phosphate dehydrogenase PdxA
MRDEAPTLALMMSDPTGIGPETGIGRARCVHRDPGPIARTRVDFARGVTVAGGPPAGLTTRAFGAAPDIAGRGGAGPGALRRTVEVAGRPPAGRPS